MWAALFGAAIGGFFALVAGVAIEIRRDCRRRSAAARLVVAEFQRADREIFVLATSEQARVRELDPAELEVETHGWLSGPHPKISVEAWHTNAAEFVGVLTEREFEVVDASWGAACDAGEFGFAIEDGGARLREEIGLGQDVLVPLMTPSWFDRHVWRL